MRKLVVLLWVAAYSAAAQSPLVSPPAPIANPSGGTYALYGPAADGINMVNGFSWTTGGNTFFEAKLSYNPATAGRWWMAASNANYWTPYERTPGTRSGMIGIHNHVLANGKVLTWEGHNANTLGLPGSHTTHAYDWNPNPGSTGYPNGYGHLDNSAGNIFCAGHTLLADGRLLSVGGHFSDGALLWDQSTNGPVRNQMANPTNPPDLLQAFDTNLLTGAGGSGYIGLKDAYLFNYAGSRNTTQAAASWLKLPDMAYRRWYPTATTQANGNVLVVAGQQWMNAQADTPEVFQPATNTWRQLTGAVKVLPFYPWMYQAPDGRVFNAGPNANAGFLDTEANGGAGQWTNTPNPLRTYELGAGTSVMYAPGRILNVGGEMLGTGSGVTNKTELIDLPATAGGSPVFRPGPPMLLPRAHVNATLLADGKVLVTGGTGQSGSNEAGSQYNAELWTPPDGSSPLGSWALLAPMQRPRLYHSTAVLLPDATVLSTGGGQGGDFPDQPTWEIFTPPYLCKGLPQPSISYAPTAVTYNQSFTIRTPDAGPNAWATWVRLSSVTHSFNMNQRFLKLPTTYHSYSPGELTLAAPASAADCPPGHYMLFLLSPDGVPSVAAVMSIDNNACSASLSLSQATITQTSCDRRTRFTVTNRVNCQTDYRWVINGTYDPTRNGAAFVEVTTTPQTPTVEVHVEATRTCVGNSVTGYAGFSSYFPQCAQCSTCEARPAGK